MSILIAYLLYALIFGPFVYAALSSSDKISASELLMISFWTITGILVLVLTASYVEF